MNISSFDEQLAEHKGASIGMQSRAKKYAGGGSFKTLYQEIAF